MPTTSRLARLSPFIKAFTAVSVVVGAIRGYVNDGHGSPGSGVFRGAVTGAIICLMILAVEQFVLERKSGGFLRRLPFSVEIGFRATVYLVIILLSLSVVPALFPGGAIVLPRARDIWLSVALSVIFNTLVGINQLLGQNVLFSFIAGRYRRPQTEQRIVLFLDMASSTQHAERLGEVRFLDFLNRFIADVTSCIVGQGGEIHKYVGDEIIATWQPADSPDNARCVTACFDGLATLDANAAAYLADFGIVPTFRAGLHAGPVVIGELGLFKMEIALLGDTMNTTARIQAACRETGHAVLISNVLLQQVDALPAGISSASLGLTRLRGKQADVELLALSRAA